MSHDMSHDVSHEMIKIIYSSLIIIMHNYYDVDNLCISHMMYMTPEMSKIIY